MSTTTIIPEDQTLLESLFNGTDQAIFILDVTEDQEFIFRGLNPAYEAMTGIGSGWIKGKKPEELHPVLNKDSIHQIRERYLSCIRLGDTIEYEESVLINDRENWYLTRLIPLKNEDGRIYRIIGYSTKTNRFKETESELKQHQDELELMVENRTRELEEKTHALGERVKELKCLLEITRLRSDPGLSVKEVMRRTTDLLPLSWQYPADTVARVELGEETFTTRGFRETPWKQSAPIETNGIRRGMIEVYYLEEKALSDEGPFMKEERELINAVANQLGKYLERRNIEHSLRQSEEQFRLMAENSIDVIWQMDRRLKFTYISPSVKDLTGYTQEEWIGTSLWQHTSRREFIYMARQALTALKNYKTFKDLTLDVRFYHKDRPEIPVEITGRLLKNKKGIPIGFQGSTRDIRKRKQAEEEILESRNRLKIYNRISNAFLLSDRRKVYNEVLDIVLDEFDSQFGYFGFINDQGDLVCPSMTGGILEKCRVTGEDTVFPREKWDGLWGTSLLEKKAVYKNSELKLPEGPIQLTNALAVPISINDQLIGQIAVANRDTGYDDKQKKLLEETCQYLAPILSSYLNEERINGEKQKAFRDLKIAKEKAEESDRLKSAFLMNLSHEVRTPLNAIMGFSSLIKDQIPENHNLAPYAVHISDASMNLIKVIEDTIDMAKLENKQLELRKSEFEIKPLIEESAGYMEKQIQFGQKDLAVKVMDNTNGTILYSDKNILRKSLLQLCDNAVKFSHSGAIALGTGVVNDHIHIYVRDTGIGIPERVQNAIFDKFVKHESRDVLYRGNGLGLSIAKSMIELAGGRIELASKPGEGSTFTIVLPLKPEIVPKATITQTV